MEAKTIQKYAKYSIPDLIKKAERKFNKFICQRDKYKPCISCGSYTASQAGHYYSAGHYPELRFNANNIHKQCSRCNLHLHGNLVEYRKGLVHRIGISEIEKLDETVARFKQITYKWDRFALIETIERYK